ncbi:hypothetical protein SFRURICE_018548 [Spodoptera frugiperda]|nr:hypothetical protein SFRURICE_018548 [Spodoptera frugiperda]
MALKYLLCVLLTYNMSLYCGSAAVHGHSIDNLERETDGSFRARDYEHYGDSGHNSEFDHEAILVLALMYYISIGSVREAEEFDKLSPDESKRRLGLLLPKMDLNGDEHIDRLELKKWILKSFLYYKRRKRCGLWRTPTVFTNPEEHKEMHQFLINQTLREKDLNKDGSIDFNEYIGERGNQQDKVWLISEKDKFDNDLDLNKDGIIDLQEIHSWIIPDNDEIADEEVDHLFASADDDHDDLLSFEEILQHHDVFVGSEATDYGSDLMGEHFDDEL